MKKSLLFFIALASLVACVACSKKSDDSSPAAGKLDQPSPGIEACSAVNKTLFQDLFGEKAQSKIDPAGTLQTCAFLKSSLGEGSCKLETNELSYESVKAICEDAQVALEKKHAEEAIQNSASEKLAKENATSLEGPLSFTLTIKNPALFKKFVAQQPTYKKNGELFAYKSFYAQRDLMYYTGMDFDKVQFVNINANGSPVHAFQLLPKYCMGPSATEYRDLKVDFKVGDVIEFWLPAQSDAKLGVFFSDIQPTFAGQPRRLSITCVSSPETTVWTVKDLREILGLFGEVTLLEKTAP